MNTVLNNRTGAFLCALSALFVVSCGSGGGAEKNASKVLPADARPTNCQFQYDEGGNALWNLADQEDLQAAYFDKQYSSNHLRAVIMASGKETASYIRAALKVPVYKTTGKGCAFFAELPAAPKNLQARWDGVVNSISGGGTLAGLYSGSREKITATQFSHNYTIMVADDSDRWTLVHEMMHHLFHRGDMLMGIRAGSAESAMNKEANTVVQLKKDYDADPIELKFAPLAVAVDQFTNRFIKVMKRSSLEETVIEALLGEAFVNQVMTFVPNGLYSSAWYATSNARQAMANYDSVQKEIQSYVVIAKDKGFTEALTYLENAVGKLETDMKLIQQLMVEAENRKTQGSSNLLAKSFISFAQHQMEMPIEQTDHEPSHKCTHSHDTDLAVEDAISVFIQ